MSQLVTRPILPAMTPTALDVVRRAEKFSKSCTQLPLSTHHVIHGGMYSRTINIPKNSFITGALIKRATLLIVNGDCSVFTGGDQPLCLKGYNVLPASAGRKQAFFAHKDTVITMLFPTQSKTVAEAEEEFTDETDLLVSRMSNSDIILITGE